MNRLTDIYLGSTHSQIAYDPLGHMTSKQADGQTVFANAGFAPAAGQPVRPHAMKSAATAEGVFPSATQEIAYTGFDKVKTISEGGNTLAYTYGYDQQRIRMVENVGDIMRTKDYVGVCEYIAEDDGENTTEKTLTYLVGPYGVFAVVEQQDSEESVHYILKDHLGSWTTITDGEGLVEQELSFDAWGNLGNPATWSGSFSGTPMFDRGYTGHEHISDFGLINMNGRCYDPLTSSFLSVDAYVQNPASAQAFNRYAYCGHNPLRYTDPTGWYQRPGSYGINPNLNPGSHTTYYSDDPNDVLWGRSVHPCDNGSSGYVNGTAVTSTGYSEGNSTSQNTTSSGIIPKPIKTGEGYYLNIFTGTIEYNSGGENLLYNNGLLYMTSSDATLADIEDVLNNWNLNYSTDSNIEGRYVVSTEAYVKGWNLWHSIPAMATFFGGMTIDCFISTIISFGHVVNEVKTSNQIRIQENANKTVEMLKVKEGGNVTVMKGEDPLFRVHQPRTHGQENASITIFEKMKNPNTNTYFNHPSHKVQPFSHESYWKLKQAEKRRFGYYLKTKGGR